MNATVEQVVLGVLWTVAVFSTVLLGISLCSPSDTVELLKLIAAGLLVLAALWLLARLIAGPKKWT